MPKNVGLNDRNIRFVLAVILFIAAFVVGSTLGIILGLVGLILLGTGLMGFCPIWMAIGFSTNKTDKNA